MFMTIYAFIETGKNQADPMVKRLLKHNVVADSIKNSCLDGFAALEGIRLCVCNCTDEELERAVKRIKEEMSAIAAGLP